MMDKYLIIFIILGIFSCIYNSKVVEGLKCDPNQPKIYSDNQNWTSSQGGASSQKWTSKCYGGLNGNSACKKDLGNGWVGTGKEKSCKGTWDARYQCKKQKSKRECQELYQRENDKNLRIFEKELAKVQKLMRTTKAEYSKLWNKHSENTSNMEKLDIEDDDDNIDLEKDKGNARLESRKIARSDFKF